MPAPYDPESPEYKKALRHHLKTRNTKVDTSSWSAFRIQEKRFKTRIPRPSLDDVLDIGALATTSSEGTMLVLESSMRAVGWSCGAIDAHKTREIALKLNARQGRAFLLPRVPGLVLLPGFVSTEEQRSLIKSCLTNQAKQPNETNLDAHYTLPSQGLWNMFVDHFENPSTDPLIIPTKVSMTETDSSSSTLKLGNTKRVLVDNMSASVSNLSTIISTPKPPPDPSLTLTPLSISKLIYKLRWVNIGRSYHWETKSYDFSKELGTFPEDVKEICKRAVRAVNWEDVWGEKAEMVTDGGLSWGEEEGTWRKWDETYEPDAGIVNFYQEKDTLMGHVDKSELSSTTPLVSISLGNAAIFLIGGLTRDVEPIPILLRSGDAIIMSGPSCRRAYHGVPRILEGTLPDHLGPQSLQHHVDHDWAPFAHYLKTTRVNINVRQVFPTGFEPPVDIQAVAHG
ncbi:uncharacterized protein EI90DRAFT_2975875 [Cantharellus anzutake]|uniref:uncharacterized protein n=1 Tax=Cantharellus anzutake TaxID=1750568 RepID=UPI0019063274|nr:uncharacterized protein EI90DRAFT_2975875 [Cantharellus anzutake]KAF8326366.1 hypothetical protein EI90DRAFT_2975875 [Cantharellus anzutake]